MRDEGDVEPTTLVFRTRYYAASPARLEALLWDTGFGDVHRTACDCYQPVVVGSK